jgi:hypothetical protein
MFEPQQARLKGAVCPGGIVDTWYAKEDNVLKRGESFVVEKLSRPVVQPGELSAALGVIDLGVMDAGVIDAKDFACQGLPSSAQGSGNSAQPLAPRPEPPPAMALIRAVSLARLRALSVLEASLPLPVDLPALTTASSIAVSLARLRGLSRPEAALPLPALKIAESMSASPESLPGLLPRSIGELLKLVLLGEPVAIISVMAESCCRMPVISP